MIELHGAIGYIDARPRWQPTATPPSHVVIRLVGAGTSTIVALVMFDDTGRQQRYVLDQMELAEAQLELVRAYEASGQPLAVDLDFALKIFIARYCETITDLAAAALAAEYPQQLPTTGLKTLDCSRAYPNTNRDRVPAKWQHLLD